MKRIRPFRLRRGELAWHHIRRIYLVPLKLLMTTTPFGGGTFTGGHVPEPSDQRTRDFDIFFELLKNMCPCNNGVISKKTWDYNQQKV